MSMRSLRSMTTRISSSKRQDAAAAKHKASSGGRRSSVVNDGAPPPPPPLSSSSPGRQTHDCRLCSLHAHVSFILFHHHGSNLLRQKNDRFAVRRKNPLLFYV